MRAADEDETKAVGRDGAQSGSAPMNSGSVHLHHDLYGILGFVIVGIVGLVERSPRWHAWLGLACEI